MIKRFSKGFTLLELLVVISIIGLLSSIVLASLNTTRVKAADSVIKADLYGAVRTSAELEANFLGDTYNNTGLAIAGAPCSRVSSGGTILQNTNMQKAIKHILANNGDKDGFCNINSNGSAYAMTFALKSPNKYICIDSNGTTKEQTIISNSGSINSVNCSQGYDYCLNTVYYGSLFKLWDLYEDHPGSYFKIILRSNILADGNDTSCN